jgi:hypothetical protein
MPESNKQFVPTPPEILTLKDVTAIIIKYRGLHEGLYNLAFQFQIAVGAVGPSPETVVPGAMIGVSGVGLERVPGAGPHTVDAAVVNPALHETPKRPKPNVIDPKSRKRKQT